MSGRSNSSSLVNCRVCLEGDENESKLLKVCNCTGSQELVHYHCLKSWIESSNSRKCSVCRTVYSGIIVSERSATVSQWIANTPGIAFNATATTSIMLLSWHFLLVAHVTGHLAEKSSISIFFKTLLTTLNSMFTAMVLLFHIISITTLVSSYLQFARDNRSIHVRGYVKSSETTSTDKPLAVTDIEVGDPRSPRISITSKCQERSQNLSRDE